MEKLLGLQNNVVKFSLVNFALMDWIERGMAMDNKYLIEPRNMTPLLREVDWVVMLLLHVSCSRVVKRCLRSGLKLGVRVLIGVVL